MTFGEKLKSARLALNLSQTELAENAGVTERSIYSYEQTGVLPRAPVLRKLADSLNVSVTYLMDDEETDKRKNIDQDLFIAAAKDEYGSEGAQEATELLSRAKALFAGGGLDEGVKETFIHSLTQVYIDSKKEAREKYAPKKRKSRKAQ